MQQELTELQPELIQTSKETQQLITVIGQETVEVDAARKVSHKPCCCLSAACPIDCLPICLLGCLFAWLSV